MRYGIITTGSRGDVQPFIALALALKEKGHEVTLVASENFREFVSGFGLAYRPIAGDTERLINSPQALKLLEGGNVFKFFYHLQKVSAQSAPQSNRDMLEACRHFDAIITSVLPLSIVYSIAEKYQKKCAVVFLSLPPIPTKAFPFHPIGTNRIPWLNRFSYRLMALGYAMIRKQINAFREQIGLAPANVMKACLRSNMLALTALSQQLIHRPDDWPSNAQVTGFFYLTQEDRAHLGSNEMPEGLESWLAGGDKPVYMGFGSIPIPDQSRVLQAIHGLLEKRRVVFGRGWSLIDQLPTHPNLFVLKYVNHDWLLPRCTAAIIHGGIGTIGAALRSGTPIVVVSILADQPVNGQMIATKRLGAHLPFRQLSPSELLRALETAEAAPIAQNCQTAAAAIRAEDGVHQAVALIEEYFKE